MGGHVDVIRLLLDAGSSADIDVQCIKEGFTALMRAAQHGHIEAVRLLLGREKIDVSKLELEDSGAQVGFGRRFSLSVSPYPKRTCTACKVQQAVLT